MSDSLTPITNENGSDDEKDEEQKTSINQKKEDAKVEKELDRVTDRVDEEEIGSENMGNVESLFLIIKFFILKFSFFRL
jgi:hypothetical protein